MRLLIFSLLISFAFGDIKTKIEEFYKQYYPTIKIISISSSPSLPKHYKNIDTKFLNPKLPTGLIKIDNKYYSVTIKAKLKAYVAIRPIKVNEYISPNVTLKEINFKVLYSPLVYNIKNLVASKIISTNEVITKNNTKSAPDVFANQSVQVIITSPNIEIITSATALNNGKIGDFINIKMKNKILKAKVIKKGVVEVE